ncbi:Nucleotidyltransferase domain-containing protein [Microlunatus soli]|uniref:Nucleotidyltransferase domain-containing protein n=1 Tax=Microlunatus soli TaxID=630515 RepID=A0A1H1XMZ5_9ACTN|nr:Nucleotidyltransferase domain-containing protein [Microlunatus soli]
MIDSARRVLADDHRVLGVWLSGSYGSGSQDRFSDVDLWVVVEDEDLPGFCDDWPEIAERIAPTVLCRQLGQAPVFNQISADWVRFDVSIGTPGDVARRTRSTVRALHDPHNLSERLAAPGPALQPDPDRVASITVEFLRVLGLLPVVIGREEYVVGVSGVELLRGMIIQLMLQDVAVEDRGGALHLRRLLPADRLQILTELPATTADQESVINGNIACVDLFFPLARELHDRCGIPWPQEMQDAARRHLASTLSFELPVGSATGAAQ